MRRLITAFVLVCAAMLLLPAHGESLPTELLLRKSEGLQNCRGIAMDLLTEDQAGHLHDLLHQILERLEDLEKRTVSLDQYREALRCPECGAEMTAEPVVALKK